MKKLMIPFALFLLFAFTSCTEQESLLPSDLPGKLANHRMSVPTDQGTPSAIPSFFTPHRPLSQHFQLLAWEAGWVESTSGLSIYIPAKAFVDAQTGQPVLEQIEIELIEIYQKSDMVLANKPTNYRNEFLISAGEFFLGARSGNRPLKLAPGVSLPVHMPMQVDNGPYNEAMLLFAGDYLRDQEGQPTDRFSWNEVIADTVSLRNQRPLTYVFALNQMGWVNCDAFVQDPRPRSSLQVNLPGNPNPAQTVVFLVPRNLNSVVRIYRNIHGEFESTPQIPIGMELTVVAITEHQGRSFLATQDLVVSPDHEVDLQLEVKSESQVLDVLKDL
jgi:hypothetical protein